MTSKTKSGIIVAKHEMATIGLAPVEINHDQSVEEMVGGFNFSNSDINSENFPNVNGDKLGSEDVNLLLVRPIPSGKRYSTEKVIEMLDRAGFIPEDIPALSPLKAKENADELWYAGVRFITALGENSRWLLPGGFVYVAYLDLSPDDRGFGLYSLGRGWSGDDWFVVRRK